MLDGLRATAAVRRNTAHLFQLQRALAALGFMAAPAAPVVPRPVVQGVGADVDRVGPALGIDLHAHRRPPAGTSRLCVLKAGRWLQVAHPDDHGARRLDPRAVRRVRRGHRSHARRGLRSALWPPAGSARARRSPARSKEGYLGALRQFFRDCQEWGWIPRRFDPARALATPRAVKALIGPAPRVIADDLWAKLLWAGLNLDRGGSRARAARPVLLPGGARAGAGRDVAVRRPAQR